MHIPFFCLDQHGQKFSFGAFGANGNNGPCQWSLFPWGSASALGIFLGPFPSHDHFQLPPYFASFRIHTKQSTNWLGIWTLGKGKSGLKLGLLMHRANPPPPGDPSPPILGGSVDHPPPPQVKVHLPMRSHIMLSQRWCIKNILWEERGRGPEPQHSLFELLVMLKIRTYCTHCRHNQCFCRLLSRALVIALVIAPYGILQFCLRARLFSWM